MRIPFSLYDFLGYTLPGVIVIAIVIVLINPDILYQPPNDATNGLTHYLPTTLAQGVFYIFAGYFIGFIVHGCSESFFKLASNAIRVSKIERDVEYTEIFDFCRSVLIKQSPTLYSRAFVLLVRHESAKLMMFIFFLATLGFLVRGIHLWFSSGPMNWPVAILAVVSCLLIFVFFYMYKRLLRYYRNTVLYGFYEYAVTSEKSTESQNCEH